MDTPVISSASGPSSADALERLVHLALEVLGAEGVVLLERGRPGRDTIATTGAGRGAALGGRRVSLATEGVASPAAHEPALGRLGLCSSPESQLAGASLPGADGASGVLVASWAPAEPVAALPLLDKLATLAGAAVEREQRTPGDHGQFGEQVAALDRAEGEAGGHSPDVAALAAELALELGLDRAGRDEVELAALLHDTGKRRLPAYVLNRAGALPEREWRLVRRYPDWGAELIAAIPGLEPVALIVGLHHERPDGRGYPYGLTGERIPLASSIVAVCDAYCAMTGERPYRPTLGPDDAVEELRRHSGSQFDSRVVEAFATVAEARAVIAA